MVGPVRRARSRAVVAGDNHGDARLREVAIGGTDHACAVATGGYDRLMSLRHHDVLEIMRIDGVTSILEKWGDPLVIGIVDRDMRRSVESALRTLGIEQPVRFVISRSDRLVAAAGQFPAEPVAKQWPDHPH
jgi:hypothetical protein